MLNKKEVIVCPNCGGCYQCKHAEKCPHPEIVLKEDQGIEQICAFLNPQAVKGYNAE